MKAMIFAAGLGTRLRPLTNDRPKAMVKLGNQTLLERTVEKLHKNGFNDIIINAHHFADQIINFSQRYRKANLKLAISHEKEVLLNTGGGLQKAAPFFDDDMPFLVHNVDILCDIDLNQFYTKHLKTAPFATLAVRNRITSRYLLFDKKMKLIGWKNTKTGEVKMARHHSEVAHQLAFSGIQIIDPVAFKWMNQEGPFSIIDFYLEMAAQHDIIGHLHNDDLWMDLGTPERLIKAGELIE